jgi:hypothetical protein
MKNDVAKTAQLLSASYTSGDLWDALYKEMHAERLMFHFPPDSTYTFRLIGPFLKSQRVYSPYSVLWKYMNKAEFDAIIDQDEKIVRNVIGRMGLKRYLNKYGKRLSFPEPDSLEELILKMEEVIRNTPSNKDSLAKAVAFIYSAFTGKRMQPCLLVNGLLMDDSNPHLHILPLNRSLCDQLTEACLKISRKLKLPPSKIKLSGVYAHNLRIKRKGSGIKTKYAIAISPEVTFLSDEQIEYIASNGLLDIHAFIAELNRRKKHFYYYTLAKNYRMPETFMNEVLYEAGQKAEEDHFEAIDVSINELPQEAFENINKVNNSIGDLELDDV